MSRTFCWEHVGTKCWSSLLRKYGASAIDVKHVCPSKPSTIKDGFSDLFYAATWQVVNIKEEEGKYGLDLRILAFEHFGQRFQRCCFFSQKHLRCLGSRLVSLPGAPRYRRARFGAAKWVRKTAGNVSGGKIAEIACETRRWRRGTGRKTREIACGKHRWRRGTGSAKKEKSWK